jgi:hypothetical protein
VVLAEVKGKNAMHSGAGRLNVFLETTLYRQFEFLQFHVEQRGTEFESRNQEHLSRYI